MTLRTLRHSMPPKSGTSFPSIVAAARAAGTLANAEQGYFAVVGRAVLFVIPARGETIFIGLLEQGKFEQLPIIAISEDSKSIPLDEWFDEQSRTFNAYMERNE